MARPVNVINTFNGFENRLNSTEVEQGTAISGYNVETTASGISSSRGKQIYGTSTSISGKILNVFSVSNKAEELLMYRQTETNIEVYIEDAWETVISNSGDNKLGFANFSSVVGNFIIVAGNDKIYLINIENPTEPIDCTNSSTQTDIGNVLYYDLGAVYMANLKNNPAVLARSHKDDVETASLKFQNATFTLPSTSTSTLPKTKIVEGTTVGTETSFLYAVHFVYGTKNYIDNKNGDIVNAIDESDIVGNINYSTGVLVITGTELQGKTVSLTYFTYRPNVSGITDFTENATLRVPSDGLHLSFSEGRGGIISIKKYEQKIYIWKSNIVFELVFARGDASFVKQVYSRNIGLSSEDGALETANGIYFLNTAQKDQPSFQLLRKNITGDFVEPNNFKPEFQLSSFQKPYDYSKSDVKQFGDSIVISCRQKNNNKDYNDTLVVYNKIKDSMDVYLSDSQVLYRNGENIYAGSPYSQDVYILFRGFANLDKELEGERIMGLTSYGYPNNKKTRYVVVAGIITKDMNIELSQITEKGEEQYIGKIEGKDYAIGSKIQVGSSQIGDNQIGGTPTEFVAANIFFNRIKQQRPGVWQYRSLKIKYKGFGYFKVERIEEQDILSFKTPVK